jgi:hypothetical protein
VNDCPECENDWGRGYPFCLECGRLSPAIVLPGTYTVVIDEVASQQIRHQLSAALKSWFPHADSIVAEERLKAGRALLIQGVDEASGRRLLDALRSFKVDGIVARGGGEKPWFARLWNVGLVVSGLSLGLATIIGGWTAFLLFLVALGAPVAGALLKKTGTDLPIAGRSADSEAEYWVSVSKEYSDLLRGMKEEDASTLKSIFRTVFGLQARLKSESLASVAAGFENGDLHSRVKGSLRTALESARRLAAGTEEGRDAARQDLAHLEEVLRKTLDWFRTLENGATSSPSAIEAELVDITQSIDRIVQEARASSATRVSADKKILT